MSLNNRQNQTLKVNKPVVTKPTSRVYFDASEGNVGCAMKDSKGELSYWKAERIYKTKKRTDAKKTETSNLLHELNGILGEISDTDQYPDNFVFALPEDIYNVITDMEIITKQFMFDVAFTGRCTDDEATTTIPEIKNWTTKEFLDAEKEEFRTFLTYLVTLAGRITFCKSRFINGRDENWKGTKTLASKALDEE